MVFYKKKLLIINHHFLFMKKITLQRLNWVLVVLFSCAILALMVPSLRAQTVNSKGLTLTATANPTSGPAPLTVTFSGSASGGPTMVYYYGWDFGDNTTDTGQTVTHTYQTAGTKTATFWVSTCQAAPAGSTASSCVKLATKSVTITVTGGTAIINPPAITNSNGIPCSTIASGGSVPAGFGAPYNVLSSAKDMLIDAQCNSATGDATINVGSGGSGQYIYNQGYVYKNNAWVPITYTPGTGGAAAGAWVTAKAKADLTASQLTSGTTYVVGYVCQQVNSVWKCGCRDQACATPMWQLQTIQR